MAMTMMVTVQVSGGRREGVEVEAVCWKAEQTGKVG